MNQMITNEAYGVMSKNVPIVMGTQGVCAADKYQIPLWEKYLLTVKEASIYFNIGENKMHRIANEYLDSDYKFVIQNGGRTMINRKKFEDFLNNSTSI